MPAEATESNQQKMMNYIMSVSDSTKWLCPNQILTYLKNTHIHNHYINSLVQDCDNSSVLAMELQQSCIKPLMWWL